MTVISQNQNEIFKRFEQGFDRLPRYRYEKFLMMSSRFHWFKTSSNLPQYILIEFTPLTLMKTFPDFIEKS